MLYLCFICYSFQASESLHQQYIYDTGTFLSRIKEIKEYFIEEAYKSYISKLDSIYQQDDIGRATIALERLRYVNIVNLFEHLTNQQVINRIKFDVNFDPKVTSFGPIRKILIFHVLKLPEKDIKRVDFVHEIAERLKTKDYFEETAFGAQDIQNLKISYTSADVFGCPFYYFFVVSNETKRANIKLFNAKSVLYIDTDKAFFNEGALYELKIEYNNFLVDNKTFNTQSTTRVYENISLDQKTWSCIRSFYKSDPGMQLLKDYFSVLQNLLDILNKLWI